MRTWIGIGLLAVAGCAGGPAPRVEESEVRFAIQTRGARRVCLVGSFNRWDPTAHPMARAKEDLWIVRVRLPQGRHRYSFLVDGRPVTPPHAPSYEADGFGGKNGVLQMP